jgi:hypothetical protein
VCGKRKMIKKIRQIIRINPIAKDLWKNKYSVIPNKKKVIPRKQKYRG